MPFGAAGVAVSVQKDKGPTASTVERVPGWIEVVASPDPNTDREDNRRGSRISLQTLIVASLASAAAAFAASRIWGTGTLMSAAITPVVVALVSEFLRRPVQTVAATARKIPPAQTLPAVRGRTSATLDHRVRELQDPTRVSTNPATPAEPPSHSGQRRPRRRVEPPHRHHTRRRPRDGQGRRGSHLASSLAAGRRHGPARLSRSLSLSTQSPTSSPDTPSPATASRRRFSGVRRP